MDKDTSIKIRKCNFIMTCAMVLYHAPSFDNESAITTSDALAFKLASTAVGNLGILVMCYFFSVTGFLLFNNYSIDTYPQKIKRRIHSLFIPYILWQVITTAINIAQKQYVFELSDFIRKTFLFEMWPADGALWYVYIVFLLALASPIIYFLYRRGWPLVLLFVILIELHPFCTLNLVTRITSYGYIWNVLYYLPAFVIGGYCGYHHKQKSLEVLLACISTFTIITFLLNGVAEGIFYNSCVMILPLLFLLVVPNSHRFNKLKVYDCTFLIYAMHQPLISDLKPIIINRCENLLGALPLSCAFILVKISFLCIVLCIAISLHWLMKRYLPVILKLLTGGRC